MSLADVSTADLAKLRDVAASGALPIPPTETALLAQGFGLASLGIARALSPFDSRESIVATLELVLEERERATRPPLELVWTGPDTTAPEARDTAVVLGDLLRSAQKRVLLAGYRFSKGKIILQPLHEALQRGVAARLFLDLQGAATSEEGIPTFATACVADYLHWNWPFGAPYPAFFYDPRTARPGSEVLLHAKCAVVDGQRSLVTSANFTGPGQYSHIEVGVLIDDALFSQRLEGQFNALVAQGVLREAALPAGLRP